MPSEAAGQFAALSDDVKAFRHYLQGERGLARIEHSEHGTVQRDAPAVTPGEEPPPAEG